MINCDKRRRPGPESPRERGRGIYIRHEIEVLGGRVFHTEAILREAPQEMGCM